MKKNLYTLRPLLMVLLLSPVLFTQCSKDEEKSTISISGINPETGVVGAVVTISGSGFGATEAENIVEFNGVEAEIITASATALVVEVPNNATSGPVTVKVGSETATGPSFVVTEPQVTKTYYIKFKADGVLKIFEESNPGYQVCGECSCSYLPVLNEERYSGIDICNASNDWVTDTDIQGLDDEEILFNDNAFPYASFGYAEDGEDFYTDNVSNQTGSKVNVTSVVSDGGFSGYSSYKVSGTFQCKVAKSDGTSVTSITEGEFVIRYTEDF